MIIHNVFEVSVTILVRSLFYRDPNTGSHGFVNTVWPEFQHDAESYLILDEYYQKGHGLYG